MTLCDTTLFPPLVTSGIIGTTLTLTLTNLMADRKVISEREKFLDFTLFPAYFFIFSFIAAFLFLYFNDITLLYLGYWLILAALLFILMIVVVMQGALRIQKIRERGIATEMLDLNFTNFTQQNINYSP